MEDMQFALFSKMWKLDKYIEQWFSNCGPHMSNLSIT